MRGGSKEAILLKAQEKAPGRRHGTAREMAEGLQRLLENEPITARRTPLASRGVRRMRRHPFGVALAAGLVMIALILGLVAMFSR